MLNWHLLYSFWHVDRCPWKSTLQIPQVQMWSASLRVYWLTIDALFAISVVATRRQFYVFFLTPNIHSADWTYRILLYTILWMYHNIFIYHDGHLHCFKKCYYIDNLIMDIVTRISLCTCIRVSQGHILGNDIAGL